MKILNSLDKEQLWEELLTRVTVDSNDCWNYNKALSKSGYGHITYDNKTYKTHRLYYEISNKTKLNSKELILHSCNNRSCCNPKHLRIGTNSENAIDRVNSQQPVTIKRYTRPRFKDLESLYKWILESLINQDTCLLWPYEYKKDYPYISFNNKTFTVHQIVYKYFNNVEEIEGVIRHTCNNKRCCNPEHLKAGSREENGYDSRGSHSNTKLTYEIAKNILIDYKSNINTYNYKTLFYRKYAIEYGVAENTIKNICLGIRWKDVYREVYNENT